jgi:hypothetical protein
MTLPLVCVVRTACTLKNVSVIVNQQGYCTLLQASKVKKNAKADDVYVTKENCFLRRSNWELNILYK